MGLALVIIIGFIGVVGITHQEAIAHKRIEQAKIQKLKVKRKAHAHKATKFKPSIARLDGIQVKNLKG